jgi:hypothetical protein
MGTEGSARKTPGGTLGGSLTKGRKFTGKRREIEKQ